MDSLASAKGADIASPKDNCVQSLGLPVTLVMAQELIPRGTGMMSGVVLGFTFIAGALGASVTGIVADQIGLVPTMSLNAIFPLGAAALAMLLPEDKPVMAKMK